MQKIANALGVNVWELAEPEVLDPALEKALLHYRKDGAWNLPGPVGGDKAEEIGRRDELLYQFEKLNEDGQDKAIGNMTELTKIPEYQKKENGN